MSREIKQYHSPSKGKMSLDQVIREIKRYIKEMPDHEYKIVVGSDSFPSGSIDYVTAIVVHRKGRGGRYFWLREHKPGKTPTLRNRMYEEVTRSISTTQEVIEKFGPTAIEKHDVEVHIDVGKAGPTREMISEVVGMVKGNGFVAKTKPDSYAASTIADKYT
jgi:uncharacterized protein